MLPLGQIIYDNVTYHSYTDDTKIYSFTKCGPLDSLCQRLEQVNSEMQSSFLQLNQDNTEIILSGNKMAVAWLKSRGIMTKTQVRNLGAWIDANLSFRIHVKAVPKIVYYHLKQMPTIRDLISNADLDKLIHVFISSRLDYCNTLLSDLPMKMFRQLQLILNAAARVPTRTRKTEQITPTLNSLYHRWSKFVPPPQSHPWLALNWLVNL